MKSSNIALLIGATGLAYAFTNKDKKSTTPPSTVGAIGAGLQPPFPAGSGTETGSQGLPPSQNPLDQSSSQDLLNKLSTEFNLVSSLYTSNQISYDTYIKWYNDIYMSAYRAVTTGVWVAVPASFYEARPVATSVVGPAVPEAILIEQGAIEQGAISTDVKIKAAESDTRSRWSQYPEFRIYATGAAAVQPNLANWMIAYGAGGDQLVIVIGWATVNGSYISLYRYSDGTYLGYMSQAQYNTAQSTMFAGSNVGEFHNYNMDTSGYEWKYRRPYGAPLDPNPRGVPQGQLALGYGLSAGMNQTSPAFSDSDSSRPLNVDKWFIPPMRTRFNPGMGQGNGLVSMYRGRQG